MLDTTDLPGPSSSPPALKPATLSDSERARENIARVHRALSGVISGKDDVIELVLVALVAGGHLLIEDVPGVGKTTLAKALSRAFSIEFSRVQFTPDLLPSDILGAQVLRPKDGTFEFHRGPVFTNVLLADEINRASPRTQSALLEAMNENQATIDGTTHPLPNPFFVVATQNPTEYQGTYPLPEAQLDRFLLRIAVGYPDPTAELEMLFARKSHDPLDAVEPVCSGEELRALQAHVRDVRVDEDVARYLLEIVHATRHEAGIEVGVSPRGSLGLFRAAQARALVAGRNWVGPDDVQAMASPVLAHRLQITPQARYGGKTPDTILAELIDGIRVPT